MMRRDNEPGSNAAPRMRLAARLGFTHGSLVALLLILLVVTLVGLVRMLDVMSIISDQRLSTLDADEELHRSAWAIEVALRRGKVACEHDATEESVQARIRETRGAVTGILARQGPTAERLRRGALTYVALADAALAGSTCAFLASVDTEARRTNLDEEMTDAWIDQLHDLHADIEAKEERARGIGRDTTKIGLVMALLGAVAAVVVARQTARSVTQPIMRLAADARRLGDGDFAPIAPVGGPREVEDLRRDLERMREKLLGVDRLKAAFLASVSHELRSPLGRLREALALLSDGTVGALTKQQDRVVTLASRACEQEVRIVEALLDMTRVSSGGTVHFEEGTDVTKVVHAALEGERLVATERGVELVVERVGEHAIPLLRLDSALVERAIANLVRNGASVSPKGGKVCVRIDSDHAGVRIDVVDDGPGLAEGLRVFEPFSAVGVTAAGRPAGIGLGLSLAREVARAHGGDLQVVRDAPKTTFRLELPTERDTNV